MGGIGCGGGGGGVGASPGGVLIVSVNLIFHS